MGDGEQSAAKGASRQANGSDAFSGLAPVYETRRIVIAHGLQFHNEEFPDDVLQDFLDANLQLSDDLEKVDDDEYINHKQGVRFTIEETTTKQEFIEYLQTPEIHLIYKGHARYGRGPCFGEHGLVFDDQGNNTGLVQTEDWEEGTDDDSGIFRMGFPYIGIEASEIPDHGYTANLVKESEGRPGASDCDPGVRAYLGSLRAREPDDIVAGLSDQLLDYEDGDRYWTYQGPEGLSVIHHAGWKDTLNTSAELGALIDPADPESTDMTCRVFCYFACSTYIHNFPIMRQIANWKRSGNERYAFWTTDAAHPNLLLQLWVMGLLNYNQYNAFQPWGPSMDSALNSVNRALRNRGFRYRLI